MQSMTAREAKKVRELLKNAAMQMCGRDGASGYEVAEATRLAALALSKLTARRGPNA